MTCPKVPTAVIKTVLNIYLVTGTHELCNSTKISTKFLYVGFRGNIVGGKRHNSSSGFREFPTVYIIGKAIKTPKTATMEKRTMLPPSERLTRFWRAFFMSFLWDILFCRAAALCIGLSSFLFSDLADQFLHQFV